MVQEAIVVIKDIFRKYPNKYVAAAREPQSLGWMFPVLNGLFLPLCSWGEPTKTQAWARDELLLPPGRTVGGEATWSHPAVKVALGFLPFEVVITAQRCPKS